MLATGQEKMNKNIKMILVSVFGLLAMAVACAVLVSSTRKAGNMIEWQPANYEQETEKIEIERKETNQIFQNKWMWKETVFNNDTRQTPKNPENFILIFKGEDSFFSTTDCNSIMGNFEIENNKITFGEIGSTLMACMGESLQDEYTKTLEEATSFLIDEEGQLILELPYDSGSMIFQPVASVKK